MKKIKKLLLFIFILPVTIILDFILFSLTRSCPTCGSFSAFLASEAALSFPLVVALGDWISQILTELRLISGKEVPRSTRDKLD
ncbi:hypothetical protein A3D78_01725 [Candidatus Gottesmanbacteria bacterium RIFCSPHIGHO2_02_FULL_39_14]|uniref:Uncharacterized protein n=3 Tax=Candidatus Gottesmaniibacteriota TaxID=1752720 RepID=A0A1F5ZYN7_9BACT|nr:MAG: hypothetical protein A2153_04270 [Candidatus Gottesmanbacteria bacterium RBG_16_38_7b]OGG17558.1 MAG: hypothetical protein A3D78_01725 [Candidatus Gottesmanbacteria bacterium RIFCSPHIGHO2_02_FULL_39_14]OGG32695.1 MAG: hypothetical protein A3I51_01700 [Candidatus Gottesmanbacteria bacterium RIFCSPLOWO2_02_FULL_38_8]